MEAGESKARDRELELEIAGAMAAMMEEEVWCGPVTKSAKIVVKKAEQELWQALETLDIKDAREAAKEKQKEAIAKKAKASKTKRSLSSSRGVGEGRKPQIK